MNEPVTQVVDQIHKPHGFDFDLQESYRKLSSSQFGGNPARGFCELLQNAIDSYPASVPFEERTIDILATDSAICVIDHGEGMGLQRLNLLTTLGGTDKHDDPEKIGKFGIGFFSIFNPKLHTSKVSVRTRCGDNLVTLDFIVDELNPSKVPTLRTEVAETGTAATGSEIMVHFLSSDSVPRCLEQAKTFLRYFPCPVTFNGVRFERTAWEEARKSKARFFKEGGRHGFVRNDMSGNYVAILCKYEHTMDISIAGLSTGGHNMTGDLMDFRRRSLPFVPGTWTVVNDNGLKVTVSRDSIMMDSAYDGLASTVGQNHLLELGRTMARDSAPDLIVANHYILAGQIRKHLKNPEAADTQDPHQRVILELADAAVYRLVGCEQPVSLRHIWDHRSGDKPVFYAPLGNNLKWLGGTFGHDFIVLPPTCQYFARPGPFYDQLFADVFEDCVNLETIRDRPDQIEDLVSRGLVESELLCPKCQLIGCWEATEAERRFLWELNAILAAPEVKQLIQQCLHLPARTIETALFDIKENGIIVATGLFEEDGNVFDNLDTRENQGSAPAKQRRGLKLGLMRSHPVIQHLLSVHDPHRAYYTLTFLAHELVGCQRMLAPCSSFRQWVMSELARGLRKAMINHLLLNPPISGAAT